VLHEVTRSLGAGNDTLVERRDQVDVEHLVQRLLAVEDLCVARDDPIDDAILHVADDRGNHLADSDIGRTRGPGEDTGLVGAEVEADKEDV
jgi:hypothetical protein